MRTLIVLVIASMLPACSLMQVKDVSGIVSNTAFASMEVDRLQAKYGDHVEAKDALIELDALQGDVSSALQGDITVASVKGLYYRGVAIYHILYAEAVTRKDEFTPMQWEEMNLLNHQLTELDTQVKDFGSNPSNLQLLSSADFILQILTAANLVFKYHMLV